MIIKLDLKQSYNHYHWSDREELKNYIDYMLSVLWEHYEDIHHSEEDKQNVEDRLYDILDMFNKYEIIEKK